jgi:hypothetical protein
LPFALCGLLKKKVYWIWHGKTFIVNPIGKNACDIKMSHVANTVPISCCLMAVLSMILKIRRYLMLWHNLSKKYFHQRYWGQIKERGPVGWQKSKA